MNKQPDFATLLCLAKQLENDYETNETRLAARDAKIANSFSGGKSIKNRSPSKQIYAWLNQIQESNLKSTKNLSATLFWLLAISGLTLGALTSAAVFYYDGTNPINIAFPIIAFVFLPLTSLIFNLLLFLPQSLISKIPLMGTFSELWGRFSLSDSIFFLIQKFSKGSSLQSKLISPKIYKSFFLANAQIFSVAFFLGVLGSFLAQVSFTDLAFSWGSTLEITKTKLFQICSFIALPWSSFFPDATPSLDLIERTKFYRLGASQNSIQNAQSFGSWWYFIAFSIFTYGLAPRLLLLICSLSYRDYVVKRAFSRLPGTKQLLWRLGGNLRQTESPEDVQITQIWSTSDSHKELAIPALKISKTSTIIPWYFDPTKQQLESVGIEKSNKIIPMTMESLESQAKDKLAEELKSDMLPCMLVKAWDIPLEETVDFLSWMSKEIKPNALIQVIPINPSEPELFSKASSKQQQIWARKIKGLVDLPVVIGSLNLDSGGKEIE